MVPEVLVVLHLLQSLESAVASIYLMLRHSKAFGNFGRFESVLIAKVADQLCSLVATPLLYASYVADSHNGEIGHLTLV